MVSGDAGRSWVPTDDGHGDSWTGGDPNFDDSGWDEGATSVGYETEELQEPSVKLPLTSDLMLWLDAAAGVTTDALGRVERWQDQLVGENSVADDAVQPKSANRPP